MPDEVKQRRILWLNVLFLGGTLLVAAVGAPWYLATRGLGWPEALTFAGLWLAVGLSVTGGYHRLFAHRTYQASWPVRLMYLVFGAAALENSVLNWCADHRVHHSNVDHERDPYNIQKGFWWAHMGWIFFEGNPPGRGVVRDLMEDPLVVWQDRWYALIGLAVAFGIPLVVGLATGHVLGCLLIGGVLRVVVSHHGTFFINSLCHMVGRQPYSREHSARDSAVMAVLAFGEGYHNFHHSFPFDYRNGIKGWHFDPAKWAIWGMSALGLAGDLRRASDAVVLKARIDVQFERAKEKLERVVLEARESAERRLHDTHARLQGALQELVALQRQRSRRTAPAAAATDAEAAGTAGTLETPTGRLTTLAEAAEARMAAMQRSLQEALREWKLALREMRRLPRMTRMARAGAAGLLALLAVGAAAGTAGIIVGAAAGTPAAAQQPGAPTASGAATPRAAAQPAAPAAPAAGPSALEALPDDVEATAEALRNDALKGTRAMSLLASLTTEVGPRPAGSAGDRLAVEWALRTLKELGFSNVHAEKVTVPHWERGAESAEIVTPYRQHVAVAALGGSAATPAAGIEAPVVEVADLDALGKLPPAEVKGKIVFFNTRMERRESGEGYAQAVPVRASGPERASRLGAAAVVLRSIGTDMNRLPHVGGTAWEDGAHPIPAAALSGPDADLLAAEVKTGKPVRLRLSLSPRTLGNAESANVIGEIPGTERAHEIVLLGAHLDSWDLGTGALDDGAGVAIVMEAARRIGALKTRPHRTLRVVLFANEEFGLSGAQAYAQAHAAELASHVVALESDLGSGRVWRLESHIAPPALPRLRDINRLLFSIGVASGGNLSDGGADLRPLLSAGVPSLSLEQNAVNYFDYHHTANDTLDKANERDLDYNVSAWAATVWVLAEMPNNFGRVSDNR